MANGSFTKGCVRLFPGLCLLSSALIATPVQSAFADAAVDASISSSPDQTLTPIRLSPAKPGRRFGASRFAPQPPPPEPITDHQANKVLRLNVFQSTSLLPIAALPGMRLDAAYNQPITLKGALEYTLLNNLPIKIAKESWNFQRYQLYGAVAGTMPFLPSPAVGFSQWWSYVVPPVTKANSRVFQAIINYPLFAGGTQVFTMLAQYYRDKGFRQAYNEGINDALLDVYQKYQNLVLQHALLQIKEKSLEAAQAQVELNNNLYTAGTGTQFAIMQSRSQLAVARQATLQQEVAARKASLQLAYSLNMPMTINLVPMETALTEQSLINETTPINALLNRSFAHRPEIRQYEMFRQAARRNMWIANNQNSVGLFYPNFAMYTSYTWARVGVNPVDSPAVNGLAVAEIASTQTTAGAYSNNALGQTASFSPDESIDSASKNDSAAQQNRTAASTDINTINTPIVAGSGGVPINSVQSGNLVISGAVAPVFANGSSGFTGATGAANLNGASISSYGVFPGTVNGYQAGFALNWPGNSATYTTLFPTVTGVLAARALARQALMQANQQFTLVNAQVRSSFLNMLAARAQIDSLAYGVASAKESMHQAELRRRSGLGTNLELITARVSYFNALLAQAQAILASNVAQAQLLHDTGQISVAALTEEYTDRNGQSSSNKGSPP